MEKFRAKVHRVRFAVAIGAQQEWGKTKKRSHLPHLVGFARKRHKLQSRGKQRVTILLLRVYFVPVPVTRVGPTRARYKWVSAETPPPNALAHHHRRQRGTLDSPAAAAVS